MKKGATLVEVMMAAAIFALVTTGVLMVSRVADSAWNIDGALLEVQQGLRQSVSGMIREIRQAKKEAGRDMVIGADLRSIQFFIPGYSQAVMYYKLDDQLIREHPNGTTMVIANNINEATFCCLGGATCSDCGGASQVRIQLDASKVVRGRASVYSLDEKVRLRNE